jgi:type VI secretion system secreted protein Hcp
MAGWDALLKIDGVESESQRKGHEGEIEVKSFSFGGNNIASVGQGSGGGTGVVSLNDFVITKITDQSSPALFQKMCTGEHYKTATLVLYKSGGEGGALPYLTYEFEELYVTSMSWSGSEGGDPLPFEQVSCAFGKVTVTYTVQSEEGTGEGDVVGSWDIRTRTP